MHTYAQMEQVCKLLADKTRLEIVTILLHNEICICDLVVHFDLSQPAISKHIKRLYDAGMLLEKKQAQWKHYRINPDYPFYALIQQVAKLCPPTTNLLTSSKLCKEVTQ